MPAPSQTAKRLTSVAWMVLLLALVGPLAYGKIRVVKHPLRDEDLNRLRPFAETKSDAKVENPPRKLKLELSLVIPDPSVVPSHELNEIRSTWAREVAKLSAEVRSRPREASVLTSNVTIISKMIMYGYNEESEKSNSDYIPEEVVTKLHRLIEFENLGGVAEAEGFTKLNLVLLMRYGGGASQPPNATLVKSFTVPAWGIVAISSSSSSPERIVARAFTTSFSPYVMERTGSHHATRKKSGDKPSKHFVILKRRFNLVLSSLNALAELSRSMPHMEITEPVSIAFNEAVTILSEISESCANKATRESDVLVNLERLALAAEYAEAVEKDPSTIPQLYISDENLLAVFSPLIVPFILPLLLSLMGEISRWRRRRSTEKERVVEG